MKIIAHIGLPKNYSTSLQRSFFIKHPDVMYLGPGYNNSNIDYYSAKLENLFEYHLRYTKRIIFDSELKKHKLLLKKYFSLARKKKKKTIVISNDILSIKLTPFDIDPQEKLRRLYKLFGTNLKIILIIRNQFEQLKSMYREAVKLGYDKNYNEFISFHLASIKNFYLSDFFYDHTYKNLLKFFKKKNIFILQNESFNKKIFNYPEKLKNQISEICKLKLYENIKIAHYNKSLIENTLYNKKKLNSKIIHDISRNTFNYIESHRIKNYFKKELNVKHPLGDPFKDVKIKRALIKLSSKMKSSNKMLKKIFNLIFKNKIILKKIFSNSNRNFQKISGIKLNN